MPGGMLVARSRCRRPGGDALATGLASIEAISIAVPVVAPILIPPVVVAPVLMLGAVAPGGTGAVVVAGTLIAPAAPVVVGKHASAERDKEQSR